MTEHDIVVAVRARLDAEEAAGVARTITDEHVLAALAGIVVKAHTRDDAPQGAIPTDDRPTAKSDNRASR